MHVSLCLTSRACLRRTLGNIQDVVNDEQKRVGECRNDHQVLSLSSSELGFECDGSHSDDTVHWRSTTWMSIPSKCADADVPDFVRHIRQKLALTSVGRFSSFPGGSVPL